MYSLNGIEFSFAEYHETSVRSGSLCCKVKIDNTNSTAKRINLLNSTYIKEDGEQFDFDQEDYLLGYMEQKDCILGNSYKISASFFHVDFHSVSTNDRFILPIEFPEDGISVILSFKKTSNMNEWIIEEEKISTEKFITRKELELNLYNAIERSTDFEKRLEVCFKNISIKLSDNNKLQSILCELHAINGTQISESIKVDCVLYDASNFILSKKDKLVNSSRFYGFEVIEITFSKDFDTKLVNKISLLPR